MNNRRAESQLLEQLRQGDKRALRAFYKEQAPKLLVWMESRVKTPEDAQELVHDTFLSFIDSLPIFHGNSRLTTFLISIAKHEVADYWRKKYAKRAILTVPFMDQVYTERLYSARETERAVEKAYQAILPEERLILIMKYEENKTVAEIAEKLEISIKAAESRLFRARQAFQRAYGSEWRKIFEGIRRQIRAKPQNCREELGAETAVWRG